MTVKYRSKQRVLSRLRAYQLGELDSQNTHPAKIVGLEVDTPDVDMKLSPNLRYLRIHDTTVRNPAALTKLRYLQLTKVDNEYCEKLLNPKLGLIQDLFSLGLTDSTYRYVHKTIDLSYAKRLNSLTLHCCGIIEDIESDTFTKYVDEYGNLQLLVPPNLKNLEIIRQRNFGTIRLDASFTSLLMTPTLHRIHLQNVNMSKVKFGSLNLRKLTVDTSTQ